MMRRRSGCPVKMMPNMSYASRSIHSAPGQTGVTLGIIYGFGALAAPFTPAGLWVEGPTALKIGDSYLVYYDAYQKKHYGALRSRDLKTWEDVTAKLELPDEGTPVRPRHGTVIEVPAPLVATLRGK